MKSNDIPFESLGNGVIRVKADDILEETGFDLTTIEGLQAGVNWAVGRLYANISDDPTDDRKRSLQIVIDFTPTLEGKGIKVKSKVRVNFPSSETMDLRDAWAIRENGTLKIEKPKQATLFNNDTKGSQ